jgi:hypothetical protein
VSFANISVADNEPVNHMNAPNLAICVAPVLVTSTGPTIAGTMESMGRAQGLLRDLILQCDWIFEKDEEVEEKIEASVFEETNENTVSGAGDPEVALEIQQVESI